MIHSTDTERAKYCKIWTVDDYRRSSPGLRHLSDALGWMNPAPGASITDWGSGSGKASEAMHAQGYAVRMVDIATNAYRGELPVIVACLWELPDDLGATDYGFCADVMEHIPPDKVEAVLAQIAARTIKACYFQIALFHDSTFTTAGPLHLSVFPVAWWQERILAVFEAAEFQFIARKHLLCVAHK